MQPRLGVFAVADGMGGYEGGEVASAAVVHALHDFFHRTAVDEDGTWPVRETRGLGPVERMVDAGLRFAHRQVGALRRGRLARMGSTVTMVVIRGRDVVVGNLGDSRVYRLRDHELSRLTRDHSVAEELAAAGQDMALAAAHFQHCLTRAVGMDGQPRADVARFDVRPGDAYLLCSDGLWGALDEADIAEGLSDPSPLRACDRLIEAAHAAGSSDNITAVVVGVDSPRGS